MRKSLLRIEVSQSTPWSEAFLDGVAGLTAVRAYRQTMLKCTKGLLCVAFLQVVNFRLQFRNQRSVILGFIIVFRLNRVHDYWRVCA